MRISTYQINQQAIDSIIEGQGGLARTQLQLSTGKRLVNPSDDPPGTAQVLGLTQTIQVLDQYTRNSDIAKTRLQQEESTIAGVQNVLQRVRELTLQANNGSQTGDTRDYIALEIRQRLDELLGLANTKDSANRYLFAGYSEQSRPFTAEIDGSYAYHGDDGTRYVQISDDRQLATSDPGSDVFQRIRNGNGTFAVFDNSSNRGDGVIDPGDVVDATAYDGDEYTVIIPVTTSATGTLTFNDNLATDDDLTYSLSINGNTVYSVAESGTPAATLDELATEINDDVSTTGVRAYVADGNLYLAATSAGVTSIDVEESISNFTATEGDEITGYFGNVLNGDTNPTATITYDDDSAIDSYLVVDSQNNLETSGTYQADQRIEFAGIYTSLAGEPGFNDRFTVSRSVNEDVFTVVKNLAEALESSNSGTPEGRARLNNAVIRGLQGIDRAQDNMERVRGDIGARLNAIESQQNLNEDLQLIMTETRSKIEDLDIVEAIGNLNAQQTALQASQQAYLRLQNLNLFNLL